MPSLFAIFVAAGAMFHTALKSSIPAKDASVAAPGAVSLTFTEKIVMAQTTISILKPDSSVVERLVVKTGANAETVTAPITPALAPGRYLVKWKTGSADGHVVRGVYSFTVTPGK